MKSAQELCTTQSKLPLKIFIGQLTIPEPGVEQIMPTRLQLAPSDFYNFLLPCQGARSFQNQSKFKNLYNSHTYSILSFSRGRQFTYLAYTILLLIGYQTKKIGVGATFYSYMCGDCIGFLLGLLSLFFKQQLIQYLTSFL